MKSAKRAFELMSRIRADEWADLARLLNTGSDRYWAIGEQVRAIAEFMEQQKPPRPKEFKPLYHGSEEAALEAPDRELYR